MASTSGPSRETSAVKTHYEILEISPAVTRQEVKDAYKRLAILKHPDKNLGDTARACIAFQQVYLSYRSFLPSLDIFIRIQTDPSHLPRTYSFRQHTKPCPNPLSAQSTTPLFFVPPPKRQNDAIDHHHEQRQHDLAQSNQHPQNGPSHRNPASHTKRPAWLSCTWYENSIRNSVKKEKIYRDKMAAMACQNEWHL